MTQVTKPTEEESPLPNGDVMGEAQSTAEVRVGISNQRSADRFPQDVNVVLSLIHI